jgi:predicted O-methyltransferase YrrM
MLKDRIRRRFPAAAGSYLRCKRALQLLSRAPQFLTCYRQLGNGSIPHDALLDYCFSGPLRPAQIREELQQLANEIAILRAERALEIGTCSGGTLFLLCRLAQRDADIISVDLPGGPFGAGYTWLQQIVYGRFPIGNQRLLLLRADSHSGDTHATVVRELKGKPLDYLFIDGDHSYAGVKRDFELYSPLVRSGGLIAFHDIAKHTRDDCQVDRFWNEVKASYAHREFIADANQGWAGIGVLYV